MSETRSSIIPDLPPGPEMAGVLATIDLEQLDLYDRVDVLVAQARMVAHFQALQWQTLASIADAGDEFAEDEVRAALCLTRNHAAAQMSVATAACERFPDSLELVSAGEIHAKTVEILDAGTTHLEVEEARKVEAKLLASIEKAAQGCDGMGGLTSGQIRERVKRLTHQVAPEAAADRYTKGLADRRVEGWCDDDGTANLAGRNLPLDKAAIAKERIDAIAKAVVAAGGADGRTLTQIRAEVYLDLLTGTITASTNLTSDLISDPISGTRPAEIVPGQTQSPASDATPISPAGIAESRHRRSGGVELTISAETLMGLANQPGHISGWGPLAADLARQLADQLHEAPWRWTAVDPSTGYVIGHGSTRRRPDAGVDTFVRARDRNCRHPNCRAPAKHTDLDHSIAYADGGPTQEHNLGALCRHDHRLKHNGGWTLTQPTPGMFEWIAPSGHTYRTDPAELCDPTPDHELEWAPDWRQLLHARIRTDGSALAA